MKRHLKDPHWTSKLKNYQTWNSDTLCHFYYFFSWSGGWFNVDYFNIFIFIPITYIFAIIVYHVLWLLCRLMQNKRHVECRKKRFKINNKHFSNQWYYLKWEQLQNGWCYVKETLRGIILLRDWGKRCLNNNCCFSSNALRLKCEFFDAVYLNRSILIYVFIFHRL